MGELMAIDVVRKRPGMYVGDTDDGSGLIHLVLDVVANAFDQYLVGRCSSISLIIAADGTITVEDDGPGFAAAGGDGVPPLEEVLTRLSTTPTVDGHRPHVHLGLGGLGLAVVNASSEQFELVSARNGTDLRTRYARGKPLEPIATAPTNRANGTTIRFRPDGAIFKHTRVPRAELTRTLEDLAFLAPRLRLRWSIEGDETAARGLAGRVALEVPCTFDEVAHARESYETTKGPIEVDVALAWRTLPLHANAEPLICSFVNLARTVGDGSHVDGLHDGIRAFLGGRAQNRKRHGARRGGVGRPRGRDLRKPDEGSPRHAGGTEAGQRSNAEGEHLLFEHGVAAELARFCVTHAAWSGSECRIEDLLVALADKLWKGKREEALERRVAEVIARDGDREAWEVFDVLDSICETIAADGPARLARSV